MRTVGLFGMLGLVLLGGAAACGGGDQAGEQPAAGTDAAAPAAPAAGTPQLANVQLPAGVTQEMVQQGQQLYGTVCVACHGANGVGTPIAPALNDNQWINISGQNYDEMVQVITTGVLQPKQHPGPMPPKGGGTFNDEQVRALAAYVYALSHTNP